MYDEYAEEALEYDREFASLSKVSNQLDAGLERLEGIRDAIVKFGISKPMMDAADPKGELSAAGFLTSYGELTTLSARDEHADAALEGIGEGIKKFFQAILDAIKKIGAFIARWVSFVFRGFKHSDEQFTKLKQDVVANANVKTITIKKPVVSSSATPNVEVKTVEVARGTVETRCLHATECHDLIDLLKKITPMCDRLVKISYKALGSGDDYGKYAIVKLIYDINHELRMNPSVDFEIPTPALYGIGYCKFPRLRKRSFLEAKYNLNNMTELLTVSDNLRKEVQALVSSVEFTDMYDKCGREMDKVNNKVTHAPTPLTDEEAAELKLTTAREYQITKSSVKVGRMIGYLEGLISRSVISAVKSTVPN